MPVTTLNTDFVTPTVQALATLINTHLTDLGHIYDLDSADPSPDVVTRIQNAPPDLLFWVTEYTPDVDKSSRGPVSHVFDEGVITVLAVLAAYEDGAGLVRSQVRARLFPFQIRALMRRYSSLQGTCLQAKARKATIGPWTDLRGQQWLVAQVPVEVRWEIQLQTGSI